MSYGTSYIATPLVTRKGGKGSKMSKNSTTNEAPRASKRYAKTRGEHIKDIMIAMLITSVVAFIGGMVFANKQNAEVKNAVQEAQQASAPKVEAQAPASK